MTLAVLKSIVVKKAFSASGGLALLLILSGCAEPELSSIRGFAQGTTYAVSYWSDPAIPMGKVQTATQETLDQIDLELSNYRDDSAIEQFNNTPTTRPQTVPASLVEMVRVASEVKRQSNGCYDLTIRPLFKLWGFGDQFQVPSSARITAAMAAVGMEKLTIVDARQLTKQNPDLAIDVSSIAQGYSTAQIALALEDLGIQDYLVEVGGELMIRGEKPDGEPWRVAVERPLAGEREIQKIIEIAPGSPLSVVTSGTYRHYYDAEGRRYSHILDGRTGMPVTHDLLSVTVVHPDPTLADAWSTALLCLGTAEALQVASAQNLAVMLIEADGDDWRELFSPAFDNDRWQLQDGGD